MLCECVKLQEKGVEMLAIHKKCQVCGVVTIIHFYLLGVSSDVLLCLCECVCGLEGCYGESRNSISIEQSTCVVHRV